MRRHALAALIFVLDLAPRTAHADCRLELELIGADLQGARLSEQQKLALAPLVDSALKHCRIGRESAALELFQRAREVAGIKRGADEFDDLTDAPR